MAGIYFRDIYKSFGTSRLFEGLSLACPDRKYLCLLGPSGCGKTTLMRIVAGLTEPDSGEVLIGDKRVNGLPPASRNIGLAFQNYALYPHLSVAGNLAFPLRAPIRRGRYRQAEIEERVKRVAALLRIDQLLHRRVNQLSGGQQQRVALGRALIHDPGVLLLDEPVTHLDARLRYEMRAEIKLLHDRIGTTTIHVTHDQQEALAMGDLIAVMRNGRIEQLGAPLELYHEPATAFVAGFIGDPPMSLVHARLAQENGNTIVQVAGSSLSLSEALAAQANMAPSREIIVGLRPKQVALVERPEAGAVATTVYSHGRVGREQQLVLTLGRDEVHCRMSSAIHVTTGDKVWLSISLDGAKLFDAASGRALAHT
ncbi:MAG: ABC transporter ATP-binding protein [Methylobacteriaceae bacterium]|nr:ABC transporter ATP-binding protein [Methylobacteriaceae bacterium]MBV9244524.1 ABC transporter ATP-binding protein [Methylobacteriaceae bacterium]